MCLLISQFL
ncbi:hypothetical protein Tsp_06883, partial [Trichinella spiralis]